MCGTKVDLRLSSSSLLFSIVGAGKKKKPGIQKKRRNERILQLLPVLYTIILSHRNAPLLTDEPSKASHFLKESRSHLHKKVKNLHGLLGKFLGNNTTFGQNAIASKISFYSLPSGAIEDDYRLSKGVKMLKKYKSFFCVSFGANTCCECTASQVRKVRLLFGKRFCS